MDNEVDRSIEDEDLRRQANMDIDSLLDLEERYTANVGRGFDYFEYMHSRDSATASNPSGATLQKLFRLVALAANGTPEMQALANDPDVVQWAVRFRKAGRVPKEDLNLWDPYVLNDKLKAYLKEKGGFLSYTDLIAEGYDLPEKIAHGERLYVYCREGNEQPVYPRWQFDTVTKKVDPDIREVLRHLDGYQDPWRVMAFFLLPKKNLDNQSPLELIERGHGDMVIEYAQRHAADDSW